MLKFHNVIVLKAHLTNITNIRNFRTAINTKCHDPSPYISNKAL